MSKLLTIGRRKLIENNINYAKVLNNVERICQPRNAI